MGNSKLGVHVNVVMPGLLEFITSAKPRVVKVLYPADPLVWREVKEAIPQTLFVGRVVLSKQPLDDPITRAREFCQQHLLPAAERLRGIFQVWEGYNEIAVQTPEEMSKLATFEAEVARILHKHGFQAAVGGFSTGTPDLSLWEHFYPALVEGDYLHLHEYSAPTMRDGETWLCLRYRRVYEILPPSLRRPLIISECGVDGGGGRGWKDFLNEDEYLANLIWYDEELQRDDFVVGATIFCAGCPAWSSFDILGPLANKLLAYLQANPPQAWQYPYPPLEQVLRKAAWDAKGIPYNPEAALARFAREHDLGVPETEEFEFTYKDKLYRGQGFSRGIVYTEVGKWEDIKIMNW